LGPGNSVYDVSIPRFINNVREMTKGQIDITLYAPGSLVPSFELFTNTGKGVVDMGQDAGVYWQGFMPLGELLWSWPFTFEHTEEVDYFYWELGAMDIARKALAEHGVFMVVNAPQFRYGSVNSTVPIKSLEDFDGLKIRGFGTYAKIFEQYGASTMTFPGEELYTGLATGVIDGCTYGSPNDTGALKLYEVAKYYTMPGWVMQGTLPLTLNLETWQALPDDLKVILEAAGRAYSADASAQTWNSDAITLDDWQKTKGVTVNWFSEEDLATARSISMDLLDEKAKQDAYSAEYIALMKDYLKVLGYMK
jgi:TRAP-type mannitol/chloroaromatic compound transport system substrate-binding protein